jgi:hypothetical protein
VIASAPLWSVYQTFHLQKDAARYANLWDRRDQRLRAAAQAGQSVVVLDPLPVDLATVLPVGDADLEGRLVAQFYGLRRVQAQVAFYRPVEPWIAEGWTRLLAPEVFFPDLLSEIRGVLTDPGRIRRWARRL